MMLDRRQFVQQLLVDRGDLLVVPGLGSATYDVAAAGDHPLNFYLWGAMGGTTMIALGLALARPDRRVVAIPGDGDMLMGLGSLATIGVKQPANLVVVVLDNARYGETGSQRSHTALTTDLAAVAAACGWAATTTARSMDEVAALGPRLRSEPLFAVIQISADEEPRHLPPRDGAHLADRFRRALGVVDN